jgi:hypothetical protein
MSPESGHLQRNQVSQIPATNLARSSQTGRIPAIWLDLAREAGFRPDSSETARTRHFRRNPAIPDFDKNCPDSGLYLEFWLY